MTSRLDHSAASISEAISPVTCLCPFYCRVFHTDQIMLVLPSSLQVEPLGFHSKSILTAVQVPRNYPASPSFLGFTFHLFLELGKGWIWQPWKDIFNWERALMLYRENVCSEFFPFSAGSDVRCLKFNTSHRNGGGHFIFEQNLYKWWGRIFWTKCLCYLFLKSLLNRILWNSLLPSFILHSGMTLGTRERGISFCLMEPQNHDILG